jgi:hypothetical protein
VAAATVGHETLAFLVMAGAALVVAAGSIASALGSAPAIRYKDDHLK